jgi:hypothetical protein
MFAGIMYYLDAAFILVALPVINVRTWMRNYPRKHEAPPAIKESIFSHDYDHTTATN